jgi:hypothetical protein
LVYETKGHRFESCQARSRIPRIWWGFLVFAHHCSSPRQAIYRRSEDGLCEVPVPALQFGSGTFFAVNYISLDAFDVMGTLVSP